MFAFDLLDFNIFTSTYISLTNIVMYIFS